MFSNNKDKTMAKQTETSGVVNLIGVGTSIVGEITSSGDIRVDGILSGSINTKGCAKIQFESESQRSFVLNGNDYSCAKIQFESESQPLTSLPQKCPSCAKIQFERIHIMAAKQIHKINISSACTEV